MNIISLSIFVVLFFFENADGASKCYQCAGSSCATNPVGVEQACGNSVSFCQVSKKKIPYFYYLWLNFINIIICKESYYCNSRNNSHN